MRIFTHNHKAHVDDIIACSIPGIDHNIDEIIRTDNIDREGIDDDEFFVYIGRKYDGRW